MKRIKIGHFDNADKSIKIESITPYNVYTKNTTIANFLNVYFLCKTIDKKLIFLVLNYVKNDPENDKMRTITLPFYKNNEIFEDDMVSQDKIIDDFMMDCIPTYSIIDIKSIFTHTKNKSIILKSISLDDTNEPVWISMNIDTFVALSTFDTAVMKDVSKAKAAFEITDDLETYTNAVISGYESLNNIDTVKLSEDVLVLATYNISGKKRKRKDDSDTRVKVVFKSSDKDDSSKVYYICYSFNVNSTVANSIEFEPIDRLYSLYLSENSNAYNTTLSASNIDIDNSPNSMILYTTDANDNKKIFILNKDVISKISSKILSKGE